jgi:hypothetical protein
VTDSPPPPPSPGVLASMCARHAWQDDIDDTSRQLLEWAADTIRLCVSKSHRSASRAEKLEAERDHLLEWVAALTGARK